MYFSQKAKRNFKKKWKVIREHELEFNRDDRHFYHLLLKKKKLLIPEISEELQHHIITFFPCLNNVLFLQHIVPRYHNGERGKTARFNIKQKFISAAPQKVNVNVNSLCALSHKGTV